MKSVEITRGFVGISSMQVCVDSDATDEEILEVCNGENLCGTSNGWCDVVRAARDGINGPVQCEKHPDRNHLLVLC